MSTPWTTLHAAARVPLGASSKPLPPGAAAPVRAADGQIELSVVGAHLSGMPLNHELTALGARLLEQTMTATDYRLFALSDSKPPKPGLLRVANGNGRAIAIEVWAMPQERFGHFVASVPSPLSIGTLITAEGRAVKGFLVEAEAIATEVPQAQRRPDGDERAEQDCRDADRPGAPGGAVALDGDG